MNKAYSLINWEDYPSTATAVNADNLNKIDQGLNTVDNRVIELETDKAEQTDLLACVKNITLNNSTGVITVTWQNGTTSNLDVGSNAVAVNFDYDAETQRLIIELKDGTYKYIDMSALITQYEFVVSQTINFTILGGNVTANVIAGSIGDEHLRSGYLADIRTAQASANLSEQRARSSELNALASQNECDADVSEIRNMLSLAEFSVDSNGNLIYDNDVAYTFTVNEDGNLEWEVSA